MDIKPLNIRAIIPDESSKPVTPEVTSTSSFIASTDTFHPQGLFSNEIFGLQGTPERNTNGAHIKLKCDIIHPRIYRNLIRASNFYDKIMASKAYAVFDKKTKNFVESNVEEGHTGYNFFIQHINELKVEDTGSGSRKLLILLLERNPQRLIRYFPVLPAGLRDYIVDEEGKPTQDEVNDIYVGIIGLVSLLPKNTTGTSSDTIKYTLQRKLLEYTQYMIDDTLLNFINKRWASRRVFGGTRNVMTGYVPPSYDMDSPTKAKLTDTLAGLFQLCKASSDVVIFHVQELLRNVVLETSLMVLDKKTFKLVELPFDQDFYDLVFSSEGISKLMDNLGYAGTRKKPLEYKNYNLLAVYEDFDKKEYRIIYDATNHPELDTKKMRCITLFDLFFLAANKRLHGGGHVASRHPVMDDGGTFVGHYYLKPTNEVVAMTNLETGEVTPNYPAPWSSVFTAISVNPARLGILAGDHDGDMLPSLAVSTEESIEEINTQLKSRRYYVTTDGSLRYTTANGVLPLVLSSITA